MALHPFSFQSVPQPSFVPCSSTSIWGEKSGMSPLKACWCYTLPGKQGVPDTGQGVSIA